MIAGGAALLNHAYWVLYLFAAFLIFTGIRMFFAGDQPMDVANNRAVQFISSHMRITPELHGQHFFAKTKDAIQGKVVTAGTQPRPAARRRGTGGVRTCRSRGSAYH